MSEDNKKMPQAVQVSSNRELDWYKTKTVKKFDETTEAIFELEKLFPYGHNIRHELFAARVKVGGAKYTTKDLFINGMDMP